MDQRTEPVAAFEAHRDRLRAVAYRMLGSADEADDAVQDAWLRLDRTGAAGIDNLGGWLTVVLSRLCLDRLRSRASRGEEPLTADISAGVPGSGDGPEDEAVLVDSVGRALLVVLDRLTPPERVAFVLHDLFAVPFDQIAPVVQRTPVTTKKLASRARSKVRGGPAASAPDLARHRRIVEAFLHAARSGDVEALLTLLAPDVVRRADPAVMPPGVAPVAQGARTVAQQTVSFGGRARYAAPALVDGSVGVVVAPRGRLTLVLTVEFSGDRITGYEVIADPVRLRRLSLAVL